MGFAMIEGSLKLVVQFSSMQEEVHCELRSDGDEEDTVVQP